MVKKTNAMTRPKSAQTRTINRGPATISKPSTGRNTVTTPGFKGPSKKVSKKLY